MWYPGHEWAVQVWSSQALYRAFQNQSCVRSWGPHVCTHCPGLPAENKVADTSWASSQPPPRTLKKTCRQFLLREGPLQSSCGGSLRLSWRRREERHYPEATPQKPSLTTITEQGSGKTTGQIVTILKGTFFFKTLYSVYYICKYYARH